MSSPSTSSSSSSSSSTSSSSSSSSSFARVEREALFSEEIAPGIGMRRHDDDGGGGGGVGVGIVVFGIEELRALVTSAESALPPGVHPSSVPIYLGATAGMRMIQPAEDGECVLTEVRSVLRESGFHFPRDDMARILSGEEEGAYDWLVANYLMNDGEMPTHGEVRGAMDLGGASVQISYLASSSSSSSTSKMLRSLSKMMRSSSSSSSNDEQQQQRGYPLRIRDVDYPVFTRSLLHYGVDRGRMRYDSEVVFASSSFHGNNSSNPCYPIGYDDPATNITGSSDWEKCLHSVGGLFDEEESSRDNVAEKLLPIDHDRKFIAMSALVYIWDYLGLKIGNETDDLVALSANARRVCSLNRTGQVKMYERHMEENAIIDRRTNKPHAQCFNAAFTYHLLSRGFGLPLADTPIEIYYDIGGTKVQWALGLMLVEANKVGVDFKGRAHNMSIAIVDDVSTHGGRFLTYFTVTILLALMLGLWRSRRRRFSDGLPVVDPRAIITYFSPRKER